MKQIDKFPKISKVGREERVSLKKIFEAAGRGNFPLFVPAPEGLNAKLIDVQSNKLASQARVISYPSFDEAIPKLLRLKPADCKRLATCNKLEIHDFPYAVCLCFPSDISLASYKVRDDENEWLRMKCIDVPPNQEIYPLLLDDAAVCWRWFHSEAKDFSTFIPIQVTKNNVVIDNNYSCKVAELRKIGSRDGEGRPHDKRKDRHEISRRLLMEAAEKVAQDAKGECDTIKSWASRVFELRTNTTFDELRARKKEWTFAWVEKVLRDHYEFDQGYPVLKKFTTSE